MWELRYTPGTRYGDIFPSWRFGQRRTFEAADATRMQCAHPDSIEVVPVEIDSVKQGETGKVGGSNKTARQEFAPPAGPVTNTPSMTGGVSRG